MVKDGFPVKIYFHNLLWVFDLQTTVWGEPHGPRSQKSSWKLSGAITITLKITDFLFGREHDWISSLGQKQHPSISFTLCIPVTAAGAKPGLVTSLLQGHTQPCTHLGAILGTSLTYESCFLDHARKLECLLNTEMTQLGFEHNPLTVKSATAPPLYSPQQQQRLFWKCSGSSESLVFVNTSGEDVWLSDLQWTLVLL